MDRQLEPFQHLNRASLLIEQGNYQEATQELNQVLTQVPDHPDALRLLAIVKLELGNFKEGYSLAQKALEKAPDQAENHYVMAFGCLKNDQLKEAAHFAKNATQLNPAESVYFALQANISLEQNEYVQAEQFANQALALNPENLMALNARAIAQRQQGNKEGAYDTLHHALEQNPEDSVSHANLGWSKLDQGKPKAALEHFREALRHSPNNGFARSGLVEALKAKYWMYRLFLNYYFWISKQSRNVQWIFLLGIVFGNRLLRSIINANPEFEPILMPIVVIIMLFAFSTWVISPLFNLALFLNPYGKYALDPEDRKVARFTGLSFLTAIVGGALYLIWNHDPFLALAGFGLLLMIPISTLTAPGTSKGKRTVKGLTIALTSIGGLAVVLSFLSGELMNLLSLVFVVGVVAFQWITNFILIRR